MKQSHSHWKIVKEKCRKKHWYRIPWYVWAGLILAAIGTTLTLLDMWLCYKDIFCK